jgi:hypothetical protein
MCMAKKLCAMRIDVAESHLGRRVYDDSTAIWGCPGTYHIYRVPTGKVVYFRGFQASSRDLAG